MSIDRSRAKSIKTTAKVNMDEQTRMLMLVNEEKEKLLKEMEELKKNMNPENTVRLNASTHACTHASAQVCTHAGMHVHTHARTHATHACMHARMHACVHARAHTHGSMLQSHAGDTPRTDGFQ